MLLKNLPESQKQVVKFTIIGVIAVMADLSVYYTLLNLISFDNRPWLTVEAVSKTLSFIAGTFVTYNLNKYWTWKQKNRSSKRFAKFMFLYGSSLLLNVGTNSLILYVLANNKDLIDLPHDYIIAFLGATGVSAVFNFMGQKFWVFTKRHAH